MNKLDNYIENILGVKIQVNPIPNEDLGRLPLYITETYMFYNTTLFNQELLLAEFKHIDNFSIMQTEKQFDLIRNAFPKKVALLIYELASFNRKRLIEKRINFIVPGKQLYLPDMLLDLRETFTLPKTKKENEKLLPSAQFIVIHHIIHRNDEREIEGTSFKEIAKKLGYTAMSITNAIENLSYHEVIDVFGEKEKGMHFNATRADIWRDLEKRKLLATPVLKRVYVDELPKGIFMLYSNTSALPEYTDLNPSKQKFYAIEKNKFYELQNKDALINANEHEGLYCLEVWKYNPEKLVGEMPNDNVVVDPLSLYLSLQDSKDERIEMALEQIIEKYIC